MHTFLCHKFIGLNKPEFSASFDIDATLNCPRAKLIFPCECSYGRKDGALKVWMVRFRRGLGSMSISCLHYRQGVCHSTINAEGSLCH